MKQNFGLWVLGLAMLLMFGYAQPVQPRGLDTCATLENYQNQQKAFILAYQYQPLLDYAQKLNVDLWAYFDAVRNLSLQIYQSGKLESRSFNASKLFEQKISGSDQSPIAAMETHANGTVWGLDAKGNHLPLVGRSGLVSEAIEEQLIKQYKAEFGDKAGSVIFYANLYHEMKHREQLRREPLTKMSLDQYRKNEIEAYKVASSIVEQALNANDCGF